MAARTAQTEEVDDIKRRRFRWDGSKMPQGAYAYERILFLFCRCILRRAACHMSKDNRPFFFGSETVTESINCFGPWTGMFIQGGYRKSIEFQSIIMYVPMSTPVAWISSLVPFTISFVVICLQADISRCCFACSELLLQLLPVQ